MPVSLVEDTRRATQQRGVRPTVRSLSTQTLIDKANQLNTRLYQPAALVGPEEQSEIAETLFSMRDELESRLNKAPKDDRGLPKLAGVTWKPNDPLAGIVGAISPFGMDDFWGSFIKKAKRVSFRPDVITVGRRRPGISVIPDVPSGERSPTLEERMREVQAIEDLLGVDEHTAVKVEKALEAAELAGHALEFTAETLEAAGATSGALLAGAAFAAMAVWQWLRAGATHLRYTSYIASGSALTAWAWSENSPHPSPALMQKIGGMFPRDIEKAKAVWIRSSQKTRSDMASYASRKGISEKRLKNLLKLEGKLDKDMVFHRIGNAIAAKCHDEQDKRCVRAWFSGIQYGR